MILNTIKRSRGGLWNRAFRRDKSHGFNMIELMTVTAVISILAAMSCILVARAKTQARETAALGTLSAFTTAYEAFRFRYSEYPQWGPGQRFASPVDLINRLMAEDMLPTVYGGNFEYFPDYNMFKGFTEDYYLQILPFNPDAADAAPSGSYYIILYPFNFQRSALAAVFDPVRGALTVRARKGDASGDLSTFRLFTTKDPP